VQLCRLSGIACSIVNTVEDDMSSSTQSAHGRATISRAMDFPFADLVSESITTDLSLEHR
jgi:hypothetical protein